MFFVYYLQIIHLSFLCCVKENWFESPNSWCSLNNADTICRIIITGWCQTRCLLLLLLLLLSCKRQKTYLFMNLFLAILQNGCAGERYIFGASLTFKSGVKLQISSNLFIHVTRMRNVELWSSQQHLPPTGFTLIVISQARTVVHQYAKSFIGQIWESQWWVICDHLLNNPEWHPNLNWISRYHQYYNEQQHLQISKLLRNKRNSK